MNKPQPAKSHTSKKLKTLLNEISSKEQTRVDNKMLLAARIDDARKAKGMSRKDFAQAMGQQPSVISKWLSGTHNFTADTLWDIQEKLGVELIVLMEKEWKVTKVVEYRITVQSAGIFAPGYVNPYTVLLSDEQLANETKPYKYG